MAINIMDIFMDKHKTVLKRLLCLANSDRERVKKEYKKATGKELTDEMFDKVCDEMRKV